MSGVNMTYDKFHVTTAILWIHQVSRGERSDAEFCHKTGLFSRCRIKVQWDRNPIKNQRQNFRKCWFKKTHISRSASWLPTARSECVSPCALTTCDSARHAWHTGCVFLCMTSYFVIPQSGSSFCSASEWWSLTAVQIDMTHSPAGGLFPDQLVCCGVISHWLTARREDGWSERFTALLSPLHRDASSTATVCSVQKNYCMGWMFWAKWKFKKTN